MTQKIIMSVARAEQVHGQPYFELSDGQGRRYQTDSSALILWRVEPRGLLQRVSGNPTRLRQAARDAINSHLGR